MKSMIRSLSAAATATRRHSCHGWAVAGALLASVGTSQAEVPDKVVQSLGAPPSIATSFGALDFQDGVPTAETAQKTYDMLDFTQALVRWLVDLRKDDMKKD